MWGLIQMGGFFNLAKTKVLVLHKKLEYKVKKLKYKKLEVMQPQIKSKLPVGEKTILNQSKKSFTVMLH